MTQLMLLPDAAARERIATDLETNFLVEAGAGAGKTTQMIERMVALVRSGRARVDQISAVTFTRKAAAELRERFQTRLEEVLLEAQQDGAPDDVAIVDEALRAIDTGFIGTIHAFCARMLRSHPIEAGLDPGFREVVELEELRLKRQAWTRALERIAFEGAPELPALLTVGLKPAQLEPLYGIISDNPDVEFPAEPCARPDPTAVRDKLEQLLDQAEPLLPLKRPKGGWDDFQERIRSACFSRRVLGWNDEPRFFDALDKLLAVQDYRITPARWNRNYADAKAIREDFRDFARENGAARKLLAQWYAHRYPFALAFAKRAARYYAEDRLRSGKLNFQDLLMFTARLLRESTGARRSLAERYRFLLVDEFQDTDPIQAEILFLLTSRDAHERDWRRVRTRPGSLFVVGDPKQSIFRFRRADIGIYNQVKSRFAEGEGEILELVANFRSQKPIEQFVNAVFPQLLPSVPTEQQAAFAPMAVQQEDVRQQGIACYEFDVAARAYDVIAGADADRIASWIAKRIAKKQRSAGDFLLLTNRKERLQVYARALEARNVPVEVTGAAVGMEDELRELVLLLECLSDPADATLTVAVLLGLFFGLDYEELAQHKLAGGTFSFLQEQALPDSAVVDALRQLKAWWLLVRREPADVSIPKIVEALGLLPYAAGGDLGQTRAGALLFALDAVRAAGLEGDTSLRGAIEAIRAATDANEAEAPLEPARHDVVRVMNLHKAKGLEAPVVILAFPAGEYQGLPGIHIERPAGGVAVGYVQVGERADFNTRPLAQPIDWQERARLEQEFERAEDVRLLYVAVTRAREELIVSRCVRSEDRSPWRALYSELSAHWPKLELQVRPAPARAVLERSAQELLQQAALVAEMRSVCARPSYVATTIKELAKANLLQVPHIDVVPALPRVEETEARGTEWGTIVHAVLEAAARGAQGDNLRAACRGLLLQFERPLAPDGEPVELSELLRLVEGMMRSETWKRAMRSGTALVEVPFAAPQEDTDVHGVVDGVIDLVFREQGGWVIVDYKTDVVADPEAWQRRTELYRRQVNYYAMYWEQLTGEPVKERVLVLTSVGHELKWGVSGAVKAQQLNLL